MEDGEVTLSERGNIDLGDGNEVKEKESNEAMEDGELTLNKRDVMGFCLDVVEGDGNEVKEEEVIKKPEIGMEFDSREVCYEFYRKYGVQEGFGVTKRNTKSDDDGVVRWVTYACSRSRKTQSKKSSMRSNISKRTDCPAKINVTLNSDGKFRLTAVKLEHNHSLTPTKSRFFPCNKRLERRVKRRLERNEQAGIRLNNNSNSFVVDARGCENLPFGEKEGWNHIEKVRKSRLRKGDVEAIINYFNRMHEKDLGFFFRMNLDDDGRIMNVFWADARIRATYEAFGDVVTIDTTYLTNKYDMPLVSFVGVNHHGHSVLLGCGLLSNEDIETFYWLFQCWLLCMSGCHPKAIITDQCKAMQRVIEYVFPDTRHRWCLTHIMKKIPQKLKSHSQYEAIKKALESCVYHSFTKEKFDEGWREMVVKYELQENEWLRGLFDELHRWVPIYLRDTFFAGMSTTQHSESLNGFFDCYVNSKTTLKQFVEQYENALRNQIEKENKDDCQSFNARYECVTHYDIEKQFQEVYTNAKFKEFQDELKGKLYCSVEKVDGSICRYNVTEDIKIGDWSSDVVFDVYFNEAEYEFQCTCQLFEFKGILCRHLLAVLTYKKVREIPSKYILSRWRKDIKHKYTLLNRNYGDIGARRRSKCYDKMLIELMEIANIAGDDEDRCKIVISNLRQLKEQFLNFESMFGSDEPAAMVAFENVENNNVGLTQASSKKCSPLVPWIN